MERILKELDAQWARMSKSPEARRALIRWRNDDVIFDGMHDLDDVLHSRRAPGIANEVQLVLSEKAAKDDLAARTLLQILLPGLTQSALRSGYDDPDAPDDFIALAWERIRTYPTGRAGSVAANVILDVRKRYLAGRGVDHEATVELEADVPARACRPDEQAIALMQLDEIVAAKRSGVVDPDAFDAIVRTRLGGEKLSAVAASQGVGTEVLCMRRWRAQKRLRSLSPAS